ncbi:MAG: hypothetical protein Q9207_006483 [Kuettlingeria erythrocarpa]
MDALKRKVMPRRFSMKDGSGAPSPPELALPQPPTLSLSSTAPSPPSYPCCLISSEDYHNYEEADEETQKHLEKEFAEAEKKGWAQGKPGSFLNKLIQHGNRKTEEEFAKTESSKSS